MRICSLLPSATEIAFALDLGDEVVGVSHECDYPPDAKNKPVVVRSRIDTEAISSAAVDDWVQTEINANRSLYSIDRRTFQAAAPDIVLTQDLCNVCAVTADEVSAACATLPKKPQIITLVATSLAEVLADIQRVGSATGREKESRILIQNLQQRIDAVKCEASVAISKPRVACLEWLDPIYSAGHWVPEMVEIAGGRDVLARPGERSARVDWETIVRLEPEVLILMPCGFSSERAKQESTVVQQLPGWDSSPAVATNRVFAVDGHSYFNRPGPRLIDGLEILAHLIHPEIFSMPGLPNAVQRIT